MLAIVAITPTDNARPTTTTVKIFSNMILPSLVGVALLPRPMSYTLPDNRILSNYFLQGISKLLATASRKPLLFIRSIVAG